MLRCAFYIVNLCVGDFFKEADVNKLFEDVRLIAAYFKASRLRIAYLRKAVEIVGASCPALQLLVKTR
jgi:hypothetical protein